MRNTQGSSHRLSDRHRHEQILKTQLSLGVCRVLFLRPPHTGFLKKILKGSTYRKWHRVYINSNYVPLNTLVHLQIIHNNSNNANAMWKLLCCIVWEIKTTGTHLHMFSADWAIVDPRSLPICAWCSAKMQTPQIPRTVCTRKSWKEETPVHPSGSPGTQVHRQACTDMQTHTYTHTHLPNLTTQHTIARQWH